MTTINRLQAYKRILDSKGTICHAEFTKMNGKIRHMNFRTGVTKGVVGTGLSWEPEGYGYVDVFDMDTNDFRMINLNTLYYLKVKGIAYRVVS